ncbi:LOW QUALITY PROTEIN: protein FAM214A [Oncorhynchus tshawytscha]|uniref:LOW QUALITY PROTEIN: protein FAM214A n=1 Tax=Oncorhynchus tshawytscha TaxID=74940 RepID=UPI001C3CB5E1|nr:LOW QUALITY PROTEIN: protein FAM214A [Oncorhynchus tshawytscha]
MTLANMKPERDVVAEEFFEYDAEDFLVFLTLLITEGRTPECSVKGRTEGLHCPPAKSALPPLHRHECSDKLPQCVQARRVRSEVCVLWRNSIPIMVEVMLLPDCCYGDESPPSDPISDPAIKQDALLLERWTLQPVPRQSGDRFIEEKTLLLAVRSYVFFSQLSAWLSASHGIVPRNILYRISAADEECVCQFSQPPAEHLFPVPNVSQSVALRLRVQSLPRQPTYPTLACSIHTGLTLAPLYSKTPSLKPNLSPNLYSKAPSLNPGLNPNPPLYERSHNSKESHNRAALPFSGLPFPSPPSLPLPSKRDPDPTDSHGHSSQNGSDLPWVNKGQTSSPYHLPISPRPSPPPPQEAVLHPAPPPGGKTVRWLYALTSDPSDDITHTTEDYGKAVNGAESSKGRGSEALRAFKTYSLAEPPRCPSPRPSSETNPLIGSLLQERQEVIARIAQRLNFCDPTAPHLPPALFTPDTPTKNPVRSSYLGNTTLSKTKEPEGAPPTEDTPPSFRHAHWRRSGYYQGDAVPEICCLPQTETPRGQRWRDTQRQSQGDTERPGDTERQRALRDRQRERDSSLLSHAVQDITRLIQDRLSVPSLSSTHSRSSSPLHKPHTHSTHTLCTDTHTTHRGGNSHSSGHCNGYTPSHDTHTPSHTPASTDRAGAPPETDGPIRAQNGCSTLEDPQVSTRLQILPQSSPLVIPRPLPQPQSSPLVIPRPLPQPQPQPQSSLLVIPRPLPQPQSQASPLLSPKSPRAKTPKSLHPNRPQEEPRPSSPKDNILRTIQTLTVTQTTTLTQTTAQTLTTKLTHTQTTALIQNHMKPLTQSHNQTQTVSRTPPSRTQGSPRTQPSSLQDENQPPRFQVLQPPGPATTPPGTEPNTVLRSPSPLRPCNSRRKHNRHSLDSTLTKAFHPCTGLPLLSSPVPQRRTQTGYFDLDSSLTSCKGLPWTAGKRVCVKRVEESEEPQPLFSASAPPASLSLLGNFEECVLNYRLEPLGSVEGFMAEVGASGTFCPSHMTFPVDVSFYSISDDNAPSPYMGVINLETLGKRGYRVPPSGTIQVTLFNPNKTVVKMFVVVYDLRAMPAGHQTFLRQRTFSVPVRRDSTHSHKHGSPDNTHTPGSSRKALSLSQERILRYLIHLRFQTSRSGKVYLHRDIRLLFSRKSMEVDSGAAYELKSYTESPADPAFSPRC